MKTFVVTCLFAFFSWSVMAQHPVSSTKYKFGVKIVQALKNTDSDLASLVAPGLDDDAKAQIINSLMNTAESIKSVGSPSMLKVINVLEFKDKENDQLVLLIPVMLAGKIYTIHVRKPVKEGDKWYIGGRVNFVSSQRERHLTSGRKLYMSKCFSCHGKFGEGNVGPNLTDNYWKYAHSNQDIFKVISEGEPGTVMMSFKTYMTKDEIKDVMLYLSMLQGQKSRKGKAPEGEKAYLLRDLYINK